MNRPGSGRFVRSGSVRAAFALFVFLLVMPAAAQDIHGLEVCTAEKDMVRRTSCLQANVEFLQQELAKLARETRDKLAAAGREAASAKAEIAALKAALAKLESEMAQMRAKADAAGKK
jgi:septal ring factor EnvC (AmiA/AmiB activator)